MSENLDLVRSMYAAWERGDFSSAEWADPEIEFVVVDGPSPGGLTGVAAVEQNWRDFEGAWENWRNSAEAYREIDNERVLVLDRASGRGKTSGLPVTTHGATLFQVRAGKVTRIATYWDRDRALADLGVEE
jgi:ketosteroid isomerase-like protein